ncbi:60S ribosomal protein L31 [Candidatus Woesearchaeota archaeon]|nr:60S ribosomal protein L31 [Candidatus Woesearchaeota archaeon]
MAKKEKEAKIVLERTYNIPLRRRFRYTPKYKKAKKAVTTLREFMIKHMKPGKDEKGRIQLKLGKYLNEELWKNGMRNPPHHIKVDAKKDEKGKVTVELVGAPVEEKKEEKKPKKKEEKSKAEEIEKKEKQKEALEELKKEKPKEHAPKMPVKEKKVEAKPTAPMSK